MYRNEVKTKKAASKKYVYMIAVMGMLIAIEIVLERLLSISTPINRYSFAFIARAISGALLGPIPAACTCLLSDVIGGYIIYASINPAISVIAILKGINYGLLLHKKQTPLRIILAVFIDQFVCGLIGMTFALCLFSGVPFTKEFIATRVLQSIIMTAIQIPVLLVVRTCLMPVLRKNMYYNK